MAILINILGIFITVMSIIILINPKIVKKMLVFWRKGRNVYIGAAIRIIVSLILLSYAPQARVPLLITGLGTLVFLSGLAIFLLGTEKSRAVLDWVDKKPVSTFRLIVLAMLVFGALVIVAS